MPPDTIKALRNTVLNFPFVTQICDKRIVNQDILSLAYLSELRLPEILAHIVGS